MVLPIFFNEGNASGATNVSLPVQRGVGFLEEVGGTDRGSPHIHTDQHVNRCGDGDDIRRQNFPPGTNSKGSD